MTELKELITQASSLRTSDIHLTVGLPPVFRIDGVLTPQGNAPLTEADVRSVAEALCAEEHLQELEGCGETDLALTYEGFRMRLNVFRQQGHTALVARMLPLRVPTAKELMIPDVLIAQAEKPRGLILVTGPTGSGKSSTLAALLDHVNRTRPRHIITLEAPIEYVHVPQKCVVNQREVGVDTESFASGLRAALRQDPDVILVGEMRDLETISTAITAAETGHLVFGTLHTKGAPNTVNRIIDVFPVAQQGQIRTQLADVLECVVSQALLPKIGGGRRAVHEIMLGTPAVRSLIRQEKTFQIAGTMQTAKNQGMQLLDDALLRLVRTKQVSAEDALAAATDPDALRTQIMRA